MEDGAPAAPVRRRPSSTVSEAFGPAAAAAALERQRRASAPSLLSLPSLTLSANDGRRLAAVAARVVARGLLVAARVVAAPAAVAHERARRRALGWLLARLRGSPRRPAAAASRGPAPAGRGGAAAEQVQRAAHGLGKARVRLVAQRLQSAPRARLQQDVAGVLVKGQLHHRPRDVAEAQVAVLRLWGRPRGGVEDGVRAGRPLVESEFALAQRGDKHG
mmetsp:Transcript_13139/g.45479  ORF Transcript_13139/g.45479 Transcript_13139/m.45479 type:complete len:219 (+) Transcript_13139:83-739(+)